MQEYKRPFATYLKYEMMQILQHRKKFLEPNELLKLVPVERGMIVADFGAGSGHYALASAQLVGRSGEIFALDILEDSLSQIAASARLTGIHNISTQICDLEKMGSCQLLDTSCDLVIVSSVLHQAEQKDSIIREAYRVLKTGAKVLVVDWTSDAVFGPPVGERIRKDEVRNLLEKHGFRPVKELPAGSFHYALLYSK